MNLLHVDTLEDIRLSAQDSRGAGHRAGHDRQERNQLSKGDTLKKFLAASLVALVALLATSSALASTAGQRNAVNSAQDYLAYQAFSKSGLIHQLKFEHFSGSDARYAVAHVRVNWNTQAVKSANEYLDYQSFSRSGLIHQLEFDGFTHSQAAYGVSKAYH